MEDLLKVIIGVLGTIIIAGGSVAVSYLNSWKRKFDEMKREKEEYKRKKEEKDRHITSLTNGFRDEVYDRLGKLEENSRKLDKVIEKVVENLETLEKNQDKLLIQIELISEKELLKNFKKK